MNLILAILVFIAAFIIIQPSVNGTSIKSATTETTTRDSHLSIEEVVQVLTSRFTVKPFYFINPNDFDFITATGKNNILTVEYKLKNNSKLKLNDKQDSINEYNTISLNNYKKLISKHQEHFKGVIIKIIIFFNDKSISIKITDAANIVNADEIKHQVLSGETLGIIFSKYGLDISDMYRLSDANKSVQQLRVGQMLKWELDSTGKLISFNIIRSDKITDNYTLTKDGYAFKECKY
ncbi:LysM-like peptidoglycan-binding domain-containing protein [Photobacterium aquimaris]|uniref:LysM domain-containing protein n=1 Tax=Photobacterium aquimaris TaxID=512643 RepID=A0A2T3I0P1_9GAMM|nr:LysM-like peptidoglycan-binding domain-containing protein [Photobacterium aquimaris]OBU25647.1 hypothetical protein AYY21_08680 [Photobacterium aquimaris]PSU10089.1 hypothetical protein C0W81_05025 [Photobacterium aquimaris]